MTTVKELDQEVAITANATGLTIEEYHRIYMRARKIALQAEREREKFKAALQQIKAVTDKSRDFASAAECAYITHNVLKNVS